MKLTDLVLPNYIRLDVVATDWKEAVIASCTPMVGTAITEEYSNAILRSFEELGPYMVIAPGIAMPHARPENGVLSTAMGITVLKDPVKFGHQANDPVRLLVTLCATDSQEHLQAISELMELLGDNGRVQKLLDAKSVKEVLAEIHGKGGDGQ